MSTNATRTALELTQVYYHEGSKLSLVLALITLSPILLQASYAALSLYTRELLFFEMWAGQLACEGANWVAKHLIKQPRPADSYGSGYGFPSSHSQYMGYFAAFVLLHMTFVYNPPRTQGAGAFLYIIESLRAPIVSIGTLIWAVAVCYSRLHLTYHTESQVFWGAGLGVFLGIAMYSFAELIPRWYPSSLPSRLRRILLSHPLAEYFRLRDTWAVFPDGGSEEAYWIWRRKFDTTGGKMKQQ
ncbi:PAP2-domain-containing protein [Exidia glandulosa HHB12029]|uniref:PAP2-domain-containing protein n=1 Tax=Exidia glandulosa HHB12029 TaxID=1314781 RepID=A0A165H5L5_EXIGL|nr:PAP2-domain-containing protein [Exidia glandulosa HHB12029]